LLDHTNGVSRHSTPYRRTTEFSCLMTYFVRRDRGPALDGVRDVAVPATALAKKMGQPPGASMASARTRRITFQLVRIV